MFEFSGGGRKREKRENLPKLRKEKDTQKSPAFFHFHLYSHYYINSFLQGNLYFSDGSHFLSQAN